jgi:hypothetical protein
MVQDLFGMVRFRRPSFRSRPSAVGQFRVIRLRFISHAGRAASYKKTLPTPTSRPEAGAVCPVLIVVMQAPGKVLLETR